MNTISKSFLVLALLSGSVAANASSYTYDMNGIGTLTGFITTDCNNCTLGASDILAWSITSTAGSLQDPPPFGPVVSTSSPDNNSGVLGDLGDLLVATPRTLSFNFTPSTPGGPVTFWANGNFEAATYIQFGTANNYLASDFGRIQTCAGVASYDECVGSFGSNSLQVIATAAPVRAPEIDPASAVSGLTLLASAIIVLRGRRRVLTP
jgi:hypothetical protein